MARLLNMTMLLLIGVGLLVAGCGNGDDDGDAKGGSTSRTGGGGGGGTAATDAAFDAAAASDMMRQALKDFRKGGGAFLIPGTPMQALKNFQAAMLSGDKNAIADCVEGSEKHMEFLAATSEMSTVAIRFQDAMKAAYGDDAVRGAGPTPFDIEGFKIKIDGDTAVATKPGETLKLVKKGGLWKIDANTIMSEAELEEAFQAMGMMKAMMEAHKGVMGKIGKEGYSAEKINQEVNKAMGEAMRSSMPTPVPTPPMPPETRPGRPAPPARR